MPHINEKPGYNSTAPVPHESRGRLVLDEASLGTPGPSFQPHILLRKALWWQII